LENDNVLNNTTPPESSRDKGKVLVTNSTTLSEQHCCGLRRMETPVPFGYRLPYWFCRRGDCFAMPQSPVSGMQRSQKRVEFDFNRTPAARSAGCCGGWVFEKSRMGMNRRECCIIQEQTSPARAAYM